MAGVEAGEIEIEAVELQIPELELEEFVIPLGILVGAIVHQPVGACLFWGKTLGDVDRHHLQAQGLRSFEACVPDDHHHLLVDDDRLAKPELGDRCLHHVNGGAVVARVAGVGNQLLDSNVGDEDRSTCRCWVGAGLAKARPWRQSQVNKPVIGGMSA